jgi:hypothetical protein
VTERADVKCRVYQGVDVKGLGIQSRCTIGVPLYLNLAAVYTASR